jgi:hypothetical protein
MVTTTVTERLAEMRSQIEELEQNARADTAEGKTRVRRQLAALHEQEAAARTAANDRADAFEEKFEQFEARLKVAQSSVAAELADDRQTFVDAVEDELHKWDTYIERLQAQAAWRAADAREHAEAAISDLRRRRNAVAARLDEVRAASADGWEEQKTRIATARDELERKADELSAKFK